MKVPQPADVIVAKRPSAKPAKKLRGFLPQPAETLTLEEMEAGVASHLKAKNVINKAV